MFSMRCYFAEIIEIHLNRRAVIVAEWHAMGCDEKEGDERYTTEGIDEDCPRN